MPGLVKSRVYVNAVDDVLEEPLSGAQPHFVADVATVRADEGDAAGAGWVVGLGAAWIGLLRAGTLVRGVYWRSRHGHGAERHSMRVAAVLSEGPSAQMQWSLLIAQRQRSCARRFSRPAGGHSAQYRLRPARAMLRETSRPRPLSRVPNRVRTSIFRRHWAHDSVLLVFAQYKGIYEAAERRRHWFRVDFQILFDRDVVAPNISYEVVNCRVLEINAEVVPPPIECEWKKSCWKLGLGPSLPRSSLCGKGWIIAKLFRVPHWNEVTHFDVVVFSSGVNPKTSFRLASIEMQVVSLHIIRESDSKHFFNCFEIGLG